MPDKWGYELDRGDLARWYPPTVNPATGDQDDASPVRVLGVFEDRYVVEFWKEGSDTHLRPEDLSAGLAEVIERGERLIEQVNTALEDAGVGAGSLPLGSPFVVPGEELELLWDEDASEMDSDP